MSNSSRESATAECLDFDLDFRLWQDFSPLHVIQTCFGTRPTPYPLDIVGSFSLVKEAKREAVQPAPTRAEVMNAWIYTDTPPYVFIAYCLLS
jgi:hypothetical protein